MKNHKNNQYFTNQHIFINMRKSLLLLVVAMLLPFYALAGTNNAITKTSRTTTAYPSNSPTESQVIINPAQAGITLPMAHDDATPYSIGYWFKTDAVYTNGNYAWCTLFGFGSSKHCGMWDGYWISHYSDGTLTFHVGADCTDKSVTKQEAAFQNASSGMATYKAGTATLGTAAFGQWHYMLIVADNPNKDFRIYVDGEQKYQVAQVMGYVWGDGAFKFAGFGFSGQLDEVQIFNKALNASEAAVAYRNAKGMDGLAALYTFNDTTVQNTYPNEAGVNNDYEAWFHESTYNAFWAYYLYGGDTERSGGAGTASYAEGREMAAEDINVTIAATPAEGGSLTLTDAEDNTFTTAADAQTLKSNTVYTVAATPAAGYQLVKIEKVEDGVTTAVENNSDVIFTAEATITATFSNASAALTIENAGQIPYSVYRGTADVTNQIANLLPGIRYSIVPNVPESKLLLAVKFNGTELTADGTGAYNFEMTDTDATITIESRDKAVYTITVNQPEGGTVTATKGTSDVLASGATVYEGTILTLGAAPNPGYTFVSYLVNGAEYNSTTVTVNANTVISAVFEEGIEYCAPTYASNANSKTTTTTNARGLVSLTLTDGTTTKTFAGNKGVNSNTAIYRDYTSDVFNTEAGKTLSFSTVSNPSDATWMHTYIYIDYDRNGLTTSDRLWKNDEVGAALIAITRNEVIPEDLPTGNYRLRFILDWENLDPCYYRGGTNGQGDNGECFIDITLHIEGKTVAERTITVASNNTALGTAAIVGTDETTITSTEAAVAVKATATADGTFMNWTDNNDREVSSEATYNYNGTEDVVLTANFGCSVTTSTSGAAGTIRLTANGSAVQSGNVLPYGTEVTLTCTPGATQRVLSAKLNGEDLTVTNNTVTFTIEKNSTIAVEFADVTFAVNILTQGNGSIRLFNIDWADNMDDFEDAGEILSGDELPDDENVYMVIVPDYNEDGECEELISVVFASGSKTEEWTADDFEGPEDNPIEGLEDVAPMYYSNSLPAYRNILDGEDLTITATFTENLLAIDQVIFAGEEGNTEYFNLQGVKVNAENLTPGIYVARKGGKAVKVLVK